MGTLLIHIGPPPENYNIGFAQGRGFLYRGRQVSAGNTICASFKSQVRWHWTTMLDGIGMDVEIIEVTKVDEAVVIAV